MSDASGNLAEGPYTYDPYGNCSAGASSCTSGVPYKYTGRRLDPETGLYYYRARYYSAAIGRFLQTDPIGYADNLNWYAYVGNDPTDRTDPTGLFAGVDDAAEVVGILGAVTIAAACEYSGACPETAKYINGQISEARKWIGEKIGSSKQKQSDKSGSSNGGKKPPSKTPPGAGRSGAFRQAKEDSGIPRSQQPESTGPNVDNQGEVQAGRSYTFKKPDGSTTTIRDDAAGHQYSDDPSQNRGSHFNTENGDHYDYSRKPPCPPQGGSCGS